jgi:uncharacterized protein YndB with AHSA1/START domain
VSHEFEDDMELGLDATVDQVWQAIATGPGMDAWFMGRTTVDAEEAGAIRADMGGFVQEFEITAYEPSQRIAYRTAPRADGSFLALEWMIEARAGETTWVRCVASGFIGADDWGDEYDALREGGLRYLHNLAQALRFFAGRPATTINGARPQQGAATVVLDHFRLGLGLAEPAAVGDRVRVAPAGLPAVEASVDYLTPASLGLRSADGLYRFFRGMGGMAVVEHHLFTDDLDPAGLQQAWQRWLDALFG